MDVPTPGACGAKILIHDDRYGSFLNYCERTEPHRQHRSRRSACEPQAWLAWYSTYEPLDEPAG